VDRVLAEVAAIWIRHQASLGVAKTVETFLNGLAKRDVFLSHIVHELNDRRLFFRGFGVFEIPLAYLKGSLGSGRDVMENIQEAARVNLDCPVRPQQPAAELPILG